MPRMVSLRKRFAELIPELAKFGVVGLVGSVVDLGGAAYLHGAVGIGPMVSKGLSILAATVLTYLGSRFWTFRHRVNQALLREGVLFAGAQHRRPGHRRMRHRVRHLRARHEGHAGLQRGQRGRNRARHHLPVLLVQEVGVPGRGSWHRPGRRRSRGVRARRCHRDERDRGRAGRFGRARGGARGGARLRAARGSGSTPRTRRAVSRPGSFRPDRGPAGWPSAAGSWAGRPRTWRASA